MLDTIDSYKTMLERNDKDVFYIDMDGMRDE